MRAMQGTLFLIEEDLAEHTWYVDLVADLVEDVEAFLGVVGEEAA